MDKVRKFLAGLVAGLANDLYDLSLWIERVSVEENLLDFHTDYATFKEGMVSTDYRTRHQAAAKLISWYVDGGGQPVIEELTLAATVLLEDYQATNGDISVLTDALIAQASATTVEELEKAKEKELGLYHSLTKRLSEVKQGE